MDIKLALFYMFSAVIVTASLSVILARHPVRAVLSLVLAFVASSGIWLLINAEFLALSLIVVYVGAVMVLFLFIVMMLDVEVAAMKSSFIKYLPLALLLAGGFFAVMTYILGNGYFSGDQYHSTTQYPSDYSNIKALGLELYSNYIYSFELAGALLMVAIIAAIALAFRGPKLYKRQNPGKQMQVRKSDRLKIVKL